jgi:hydrogenase expression/formation protein HypC
MCLTIPMCVVQVDGLTARCEAKGVQREASLLLLHESVAVGDMVLVHLGHAVQKVSHDEAEQAWALYDELLAALDGHATPADVEADR